MLRQVIETIEHPQAAGSIQRGEPQSAPVERALAHCLQELRAIVALEARGPDARRARLRVV
jgi:hypothetical protein